LHRAKTETTRFLQAVLTHRATNPLPAPAGRHHEGCVGHMPAASRLIGVQRVNANDLSILFSNEGARSVLKPVGKRVLDLSFRIILLSCRPRWRHLSIADRKAFFA